MSNMNVKNTSRRAFLKTSAIAGGGLFVGFNYIGCTSESAPIEVMKAIPKEWFAFDAYIKIGETGLVTIMSTNPEIGQNVKTSMPMIVAEELDVAWRDVVVEQAPLNTDWYERQVAGGSQSIRSTWDILRKAGAKTRSILVDTAAEIWESDVADCTVADGIITHTDGRQLSYGELAAKTVDKELPEEVKLKDPKDFKIIGKSKTNVDMQGILTGMPLFGIDTKKEGMAYACAVRPPSFGQVMDSYDDSETLKINGVQKTIRFGDKVAVLASNTWAAIKGAKAIKATWSEKSTAEDTALHSATLREHLEKKSAKPRRVDGDVDKAFAQADQVVERIYEAPFLPHACMEPMNFYADVTDAKVLLEGPIQTPAWTEQRVAGLLERDVADIEIKMTRMGGGFGRRLYGDFTLEAAEISSLAKQPIQLVFTREDDMHAGTYRPASAYKFKVGIKDNEITSWHLTEAFYNGEMFGSMPSNFPCGAIENYRVDCHNIKTNITTGAWRAPYANFLAFAEQAFMDELAVIVKKDPIQFRLDLLAKAKNNPVGEEYNYDADKFEGVIKLAVEKAGFGKSTSGLHQGISAYYSHNTYVAEIAEVAIKDGSPVIKNIVCAVDCGIVVNPIAALNQIEGGIIDGIGHAMFGDFSFEEGRAQSSNYHQYRLIRMPEVPTIDVHFVESYNDPTGLGEPTLPPAGGAIANALHAATGKRLYQQPFVKHLDELG